MRAKMPWCLSVCVARYRNMTVTAVYLKVWGVRDRLKRLKVESLTNADVCVECIIYLKWYFSNSVWDYTLDFPEPLEDSETKVHY